MKRTQLKVWACGLALVVALHGATAAQKAQKVVVTSPLTTDVVVTQQQTCQIRSQRHIEIRALSGGYLEAIPVKEGQAVKKGEVLFRVVPILYKAKLDAEMAEVQLAQIKFENTKRLVEKKVISLDELKLAEAELARAQAKAKLAEAELNFTVVRAPFDGLVGRLGIQEGSLVTEKDTLTTLSDNSVMWAYFNVTEARYLEYKLAQIKATDPSRLEFADSRIALVLADGSTFKHDAGNTVTAESTFNNDTGNIACRADFPNPDGLLRHGMTGSTSIRRTLKKALVIPQRATFEILDRRFVYVVGMDAVARQREVTVAHELEDVFVIKKGLDEHDKIVLEGVRRVREGDKLEYEFLKPEEAVRGSKTQAE